MWKSQARSCKLLQIRPWRRYQLSQYGYGTPITRFALHICRPQVWQQCFISFIVESFVLWSRALTTAAYQTSHPFIFSVVGRRNRPLTQIYWITFCRVEGAKHCKTLYRWLYCKLMITRLVLAAARRSSCNERCISFMERSWRQDRFYVTVYWPNNLTFYQRATACDVNTQR